MRNEKLITFAGQTLSVTAWARKYNLGPDTLHKRLQRGMPIKEALFTPTDRSERIITPAGALTAKQIAKALNMSYGGVRLRRQRGWSDHELSLPKVVEHNPKLTAFGKTKTIGEWARELGLKRRAIYKRIRKGLPLEEALSMPRSTKDGVKVTAFGKSQTILQWARERGLNQTTIRSRLQHGVPPEVALTAPIAGKNNR